MVVWVQVGPIIGLTGQFILLTGLGATTGLGAAGWVTGVAYGLVTAAMLTRAAHRAGVAAFGPADWVTQLRAALVGCVTALTADNLQLGTPVAPLVTIAAVALVLDAVDGYVARRTRTASAFGARFDMETDAFLILVLSVAVYTWAGVWVLAIGAMRYAYVAASWALPWLRLTVPPRYWRKVVAATQGIVLAVAAARVLPDVLVVAAVVAALALLVESFGRDVVWQWRHRAAGPSQPVLSPAGSDTERELPAGRVRA